MAKQIIERLTKKVLLTLPAGSFLASDVRMNPVRSVFAESVVPMEQRQEQWERIKQARVEGRRAALHASAEEYIEDEMALAKGLGIPLSADAFDWVPRDHVADSPASDADLRLVVVS